MKRVKILVSGPFASGKTSLISTISEIPVIRTEKVITDETKQVKFQTTVALDFGRITIDKDLVLFIFGTPGQERFSYMWDVLSVGAVGLVLMVDATDYKSVIHAKRYISYFLPKLKIPCVIAANKQDLGGALSPKQIHKMLSLDDSIEVVPCIATQKESVKTLLIKMFEVVNHLGLVKEEDYDFPQNSKTPI